MNLEVYTKSLRNNLKVFEGLLIDLSEDEAKWKPSVEKWSILENINHLADEEIYDFRVRLKSLLETPEKNWEPVDPSKWVNEREYNNRDLAESFERFRQERSASLNWLENVENPEWNNFYDHSTGKISAGDLLVSWVAHDFLHFRQIAFLRWELLKLVSNQFSSSYAGSW
ncbi:MAG: DinB family protein [Pyrinomonadaceae bacterium]|nr:DinB family protein [Pyrinomonadaceae bacterium]